MTAALRMAWRETRGAGRHFAYFAAIVAVASLAASLDRTVARSAKALMGGDAEIRASRPLSAEAERAVSAVAAEGVLVTRVRELVAMAQTTGGEPRSQLVEV